MVICISSAVDQRNINFLGQQHAVARCTCGTVVNVTHMHPGAWVQLPLIAISVNGDGRKGIWPKLLPCV